MIIALYKCITFDITHACHRELKTLFGVKVSIGSINPKNLSKEDSLVDYSNRIR